jgi:hypothetical protein
MADEEVQIQPKAASDFWSYRIVIGGLVISLFVVLAGMIFLPFIGKEAPSELSAIAMPIITALAAILRPVGGEAK